MTTAALSSKALRWATEIAFFLMLFAGIPVLSEPFRGPRATHPGNAQRFLVTKPGETQPQATQQASPADAPEEPGILRLPNGERIEKWSYYLLRFLAVLWFLFELRGVARSVNRGHPFARANASRVRRMAVITLVWGALFPPLKAWMYRTVGADSRYLDGSHPVDFSPNPFLVALTLFVLADVFARGADLSEADDLTV